MKFVGSRPFDVVYLVLCILGKFMGCAVRMGGHKFSSSGVIGYICWDSLFISTLKWFPKYIFHTERLIWT
jgi:hypothetical protein